MRDLLATHREMQQSKGKRAASIDEDKLDEYTETLLKIFDSNQDGKLQLSEMTK